jgi:hypothetical protein
MSILSKLQLISDVASNIYTNTQRLIKGNTVKARLLNIVDSTFIRVVDTASNFTANNQILSTGEIGIESDSLTTSPKFKIGDGVTTWNTLPYSNVGSETLQQAVDNGNTVLQSDNATTLFKVDRVNNEMDINGTFYSTSLDNGSALGVRDGDSYLAWQNKTNPQTVGEVHFNSTKGEYFYEKTSSGTLLAGGRVNIDLTLMLIKHLAKISLSSPLIEVSQNPTTNLGIATKQYVDASVPSLTGYEVQSNKATDFTTVNNTLYPSVQAVQNYVTNAVAGLLDYRGGYDASTNAFPSTGGSGIAGVLLKGDFWFATVAGTLDGIAVKVGDMIIANADAPAQVSTSWDIISTELGYTPANRAGDTFTGSISATNLSGTNTGNETLTTIATISHSATAKTVLVDADEVTGQNSATSFSLMRTVWSDVWTYINSKVSAIYAPLASPTFTGNPKNAQYTISASAIDWTSAKYFYKTLSANTTFTFSNVADGLEITLAITNTASNYTVTFPTADWGSAGAPVQRIGANTDIYGFVRINGTIYGTVRQ